MTIIDPEVVASPDPESFDDWTSRSKFRGELADRVRDELLAEAYTVGGGEDDGLRVITARKVDEAIARVRSIDLPPINRHGAEVLTGAILTVWAVCPRCKVAGPITMAVDAVLEQDATSSELRLKAKAKKRTHVCGQLPIPSDIVEGQTSISDLIGAPCGEPVVVEDALDPDDDDVVEAPRCILPKGHEGDCVASEADEPPEGTALEPPVPPAPSVNLEPLPWSTDDDDLLPGEPVAAAQAPAFDLGACPFPGCTLAAEHTGDHNAPPAFVCDVSFCDLPDHGHAPITSKASRTRRTK